MNNEDLTFYILCIFLIMSFYRCVVLGKNKITFVICFVCFQLVFFKHVGVNTIIIKTHIQENGEKEIVKVRVAANPFLPVNVREKVLQEEWWRLKNDMKQNPKIVKIELI